MARRVCAVIVVLSCLLGNIGAARSWGYWDDGVFGDASGTELPSIFNYGWRGLFGGLLAGLAAGYIRYADENNTNGILKSVGYGSLAGAGFGLVMGVIDASYGQKGPGFIILRDMNLAGGFGVAVGAIYGGIDALVRSDWKVLGKDAAWGFLGGLAFGLGAGIYESSQPATFRQRTTATSCGVIPRVAFYEDSRKNSCPGLQMDYSF